MKAPCPGSVRDCRGNAPACLPPAPRGERFPSGGSEPATRQRTQQRLKRLRVTLCPRPRGLREAPPPGQVLLTMDYIFNVWKPTGNPRRRTDPHRQEKDTDEEDAVD